MGGSAIRTGSQPDWRFTVPVERALGEINRHFTPDRVAEWSEPVREALAHRAPLSRLSEAIGIDPEQVAPGNGEAFHAWLDEDWTPAAKRRLRSLLRQVLRTPGPVTFSWGACGDWDEFSFQTSRRGRPPERSVHVETPHP